MVGIGSVLGYPLMRNKTTLVIGEVVLDTSESWTIPSIFIDIFGLTWMAIARWLAGSAKSYLESKPLGMESLMDIPLKLTFRILRIITIAMAISLLITNHEVDVGDTMAKILMWPLFDITVIAFYMLATIPITQAVLVANPGLELPISDSLASKFLLLVITGPVLILNIILHLEGIYPPPYYGLRRLPLTNAQVPFQAAVLVMFVIIVLAFIVVRITIYWFNKHKDKSHPQSGQLLTNKALICILCILACFFAILQGIDQGSHAILAINIMFGSVMITITFFSNQLSAHLKKSHIFLHSMLNCFRRRPCKKVEPALEMSQLP